MSERTIKLDSMVLAVDENTEHGTTWAHVASAVWIQTGKEKSERYDISIPVLIETKDGEATRYYDPNDIQFSGIVEGPDEEQAVYEAFYEALKFRHYVERKGLVNILEYQDELLRLLSEHTDGAEAMRGPGAFAMQLETMAMMLESIPMLQQFWEKNPKEMRNHISGLRIRANEIRDTIRKIVSREEWEAAATAEAEKTDADDES